MPRHPITVNLARVGDTVVAPDGSVGKIVERRPHAIVAEVGTAQIGWKLKGREHYAAALPTGHRVVR